LPSHQIAYKSLPLQGFVWQPMSQARMRDDIWSEAESLTEEDRVEMDKPFTEEEIKNVVDQMEKNKAAGPDSFPIEFYQACWDIIKQDLMLIFSDFHQDKIDLARINYGVITLLPKGADANTIQKYRPLSLLQVLFKIFTKALTVRFEIHMRKIIHAC
jgi:mannosylglycoprotein endo-beta-mannosidase